MIIEVLNLTFAITRSMKIVRRIGKAIVHVVDLKRMNILISVRLSLLNIRTVVI